MTLPPGWVARWDHHGDLVVFFALEFSLLTGSPTSCAKPCSKAPSSKKAYLGSGAG